MTAAATRVNKKRHDSTSRPPNIPSHTDSEGIQVPAAPIVSEQLIKPFARRAMFMRPTYLEESAWLEHIPFAFWLIEAQEPAVFVELGSHYGSSYFAFCQAVDRTGLNTQCFAVDTWKGDEHSGLYGEEVYAKVCTYNEAQYSGFSRLVRSSFDEALGYFSDGSIDLLHIDGCHTYEAVKHDFDSWLPKLSHRGVVIFHDCNVRERNFGVFRLVKELRQAYPGFEFSHGHGLAVLGIGPMQNDLMRLLFHSATQETACRAISEVFARLGKSCYDAYAAAVREGQIRELTSHLDHNQAEIGVLREALDATRSELDKRASELGETRAQIRAQSEQHAMERGQFTERVSLLEEFRAEAREMVARLNQRLDQAASDLKERGDALLAIQLFDKDRQSLLHEAERTADDYRQAAEQLREDYRQAAAERDRLKAENEAQCGRLDQFRDEIATLKSRLQEAEGGAAEREEALAEAMAERVRLATEGDALRTRLEEARADSELRQRAADQAAEQLREDYRQAAAERDRLKAENEAQCGRLDERSKEIATLTKILQAAEETAAKQAEALSEVVAERDQLRAECEALGHGLHQHDGEVMALTAQLKSETQTTMEQQATLTYLSRLIDCLLPPPFMEDELEGAVLRVKQAGIVDEAWYLTKYPDVANEKVDPILHYVRYGVHEKRQPSAHSIVEHDK